MSGPVNRDTLRNSFGPISVVRSLLHALVAIPGLYARNLLELSGLLYRGWQRFFFTPADPTTLGLIRILVGLILLWNFANIGLDLRDYLGSDGLVSLEALRSYYAHSTTGKTAWSLWFFVPDRFLFPTWTVCLLVLVLFTLGVFSRVTSVLAWAITVSTVRRVPVVFFGFDQTVVAWAMYLAVCMASGQTLSVDRLRKRRRGLVPDGPPRPTVSANLGLRLIQLHLCLTYAAAGLAKLQGVSWWNGDAVAMILLIPVYRVGHFEWLLAYPRLLFFLTHATVALEILYPVLIWFRVFRPLLLTAMVLLHVGIDLTLGLREFTLAMIVANLAFVPGETLRELFVPGARKTSPAE
jgi:hypothetical protein